MQRKKKQHNKLLYALNFLNVLIPLMQDDEFGNAVLCEKRAILEQKYVWGAPLDVQGLEKGCKRLTKQL